MRKRSHVSDAADVSVSVVAVKLLFVVKFFVREVVVVIDIVDVFDVADGLVFPLIEAKISFVLCLCSGPFVLFTAFAIRVRLSTSSLRTTLLLLSLNSFTFSLSNSSSRTLFWVDLL